MLCSDLWWLKRSETETETIRALPVYVPVQETRDSRRPAFCFGMAGQGQPQGRSPDGKGRERETETLAKEREFMILNLCMQLMLSLVGELNESIGRLLPALLSGPGGLGVGRRLRDMGYCTNTIPASSSQTQTGGPQASRSQTQTGGPQERQRPSVLTQRARGEANLAADAAEEEEESLEEGEPEDNDNELAPDDDGASSGLHSSAETDSDITRPPSPPDLFEHVAGQVRELRRLELMRQNLFEQGGRSRSRSRDRKHQSGPRWETEGPTDDSDWL